MRKEKSNEPRVRVQMSYQELLIVLCALESWGTEGKPERFLYKRLNRAGIVWQGKVRGFKPSEELRAKTIQTNNG